MISIRASKSLQHDYGPSKRILPRLRIREGAPIELPHILILIDDLREEVIEPLVNAL